MRAALTVQFQERLQAMSQKAGKDVIIVEPSRIQGDSIDDVAARIKSEPGKGTLKPDQVLYMPVYLPPPPSEDVSEHSTDSRLGHWVGLEFSQEGVKYFDPQGIPLKNFARLNTKDGAGKSHYYYYLKPEFLLDMHAQLFGTVANSEVEDLTKHCNFQNAAQGNTCADWIERFMAARIEGDRDLSGLKDIASENDWRTFPLLLDPSTLYDPALEGLVPRFGPITPANFSTDDHDSINQGMGGGILRGRGNVQEILKSEEQQGGLSNARHSSSQPSSSMKDNRGSFGHKRGRGVLLGMNQPLSSTSFISGACDSKHEVLSNEQDDWRSEDEVLDQIIFRGIQEIAGDPSNAGKGFSEIIDRIRGQQKAVLVEEKNSQPYNKWQGSDDYLNKYIKARYIESVMISTGDLSRVEKMWSDIDLGSETNDKLDRTFQKFIAEQSRSANTPGSLVVKARC